MKEAPHLNKNSHRLPNVSRTIQYSKERILQSPMPNEYPANLHHSWPEKFKALRFNLIGILVPLAAGSYKFILALARTVLEAIVNL